jgi:hypothetical protein
MGLQQLHPDYIADSLATADRFTHDVVADFFAD